MTWTARNGQAWIAQWTTKRHATQNTWKLYRMHKTTSLLQNMDMRCSTRHALHGNADAMCGDFARWCQNCPIIHHLWNKCCGVCTEWFFELDTTPEPPLVFQRVPVFAASIARSRRITILTFRAYFPGDALRRRRCVNNSSPLLHGGGGQSDDCLGTDCNWSGDNWNWLLRSPNSHCVWHSVQQYLVTSWAHNCMWRRFIKTHHKSASKCPPIPLPYQYQYRYQHKYQYQYQHQHQHGTMRLVNSRLSYSCVPGIQKIAVLKFQTLLKTILIPFILKAAKLTPKGFETWSMFFHFGPYRKIESRFQTRFRAFHCENGNTDAEGIWNLTNDFQFGAM